VEESEPYLLEERAFLCYSEKVTLEMPTSGGALLGG